MHASETLDVRNFFNSHQCLGIRNFGCAHLVNSLLDGRKQKARDRCVLSSCGPIVAQTETCTLSTINFLIHCIFKLKLKHVPCCASSDSFLFFGEGGGGVINIACVSCGCSLVNLGSKQKKNERDQEIKQCMCTISPSCDVFSFYLFIYLFWVVGGGEYCRGMCYVKVFHWWHKKEKKKKKKKKKKKSFFYVFFLVVRFLFRLT